jgi:class 3 adenylate cyclase
MKQLLLVLAGFVIPLLTYSQKVGQQKVDSLLSELPAKKDDTSRINLLVAVALNCIYSNQEQGLKAAAEALQLSEKINWPKGIAQAKTATGRIQWRKGEFESALENHQQALAIFELQKDQARTALLLTYIGQDYADNGKFAEAYTYWNRAFRQYEMLNDQDNLARVHILFGWLYDNLGNTPAAVKNNFTALRIYEALGDRGSMAIATSAIAKDYVKLRNYDQALNFFRQALKAHYEEGNRIQLPSTYIEIGNVYLSLGQFSSAKKALDTALRVSIEITDTVSIAQSYHATGQLYLRQQEVDRALLNFTRASSLYEKVGYQQEQAKVYGGMGVCYTGLKQYAAARTYFDRQKNLARELNSQVAMIEYYRGVYLLDSAVGNLKDAYLNYKRYLKSRDSLSNAQSINAVIQLQLNYELEQKESARKIEQEKKDLRAQLVRNSFIAGLGGSLIFLAIVYRQRNKLSNEKKRSDELLLNILPRETAEELKNNGSASARNFAEVSVMFTDFKDFTTFSETMTAHDLVKEINFLYSAYDKIISKYNIEKIKTIGDGYMCAAGLPIANEHHALDLVRAALEIQRWMIQLKAEREEQGRQTFEVRIGIHTGPVIAGIVGIKKFAYDIWGDTVNVAARMESSGRAGQVNISGATYELVKNHFHCTYRGKIPAKNKGAVEMYFVEEAMVSTANLSQPS